MAKVSTDLLLYWAEKMGIKIIFTKLRKGCLGRADAARKIIKLDVSLRDNHPRLRSVLTEEIGHIIFPPMPGHIRYHSRSFYKSENCGLIQKNVAQDERLARDWATGVLMPDVEFNRILEDGSYSISDIAEIFEVEKWFVEHKVRYYRRKGYDI